MKKRFIPIFLFTLTTTLFSKSPIRYEISFDNALHHEARILVSLEALPAGPVHVMMSRSSPGRYALHEFAKNIYHVRAFDANGKALVIEHPTPHQWTIPSHGNEVKISYTLYADRADGTYSAIDVTHAHLNTPATFMWVRGLEHQPIELKINVPNPAWKIATQLPPTETANVFAAPDLDYFMDSPIEIGDFDLRKWQVNSNGNSKTFRLVLHHKGTEKELDAYVRMAQAVVLEEKAIFAELPEFDYGTYTFIADYLPYVSGDGMEHRNSTVMTSSRSLQKDAVRLVNTVAHEFFHSWNVERIRPKSLQPFDFERANMCGELWFAEGFTSYYGDLVVHRAGLNSLDEFAKGMSRRISAVINSPARRFSTPVEMSRMAPFVDAATSNDPQNRENTFISYYTYGYVMALGLDLTLRTRFENLTLDDFMRAVWQTYGKTEIPYTSDDLRNKLGEFTRDQEFADDFFAKHINGHETIDYADLLSRVGLLLRSEDENRASLGPVKLKSKCGKAFVKSATIIGSPLYEAGLDRGDTILTIAGQTIQSAADFDSVLAAHNVGEEVGIQFQQRAQLKVARITFAKDPKLEIVPYERAGLTMTDKMLSLRNDWLRSHASEKVAGLNKYCPVCKRAYPFESIYCRYDGEPLQIARPD